MMMDDETLQMYVEEATEHLGDIENDLLAIEQSGADIDVELVNKVFRAAHSIKGGAGFLGLIKIKDLGHKIENVLDMVRNRELVPDPEVVNIVLLAFDKLRDMIVNVAESEDAYIDDHIAALTAATSANLKGEEKASVDRRVEIKDGRGRVVFEVPEFDLLQNRKGGKNLYLLEFDLIHDVQRKEKTIFDILKCMDSTGVVRLSIPTPVMWDSSGAPGVRGPVVALPVREVLGDLVGHALPPHSAVVRESHVGEDGVAAGDRVHGVRVGGPAGSRRHAEQPGLQRIGPDRDMDEVEGAQRLLDDVEVAAGDGIEGSDIEGAGAGGLHRSSLSATWP